MEVIPGSKKDLHVMKNLPRYALLLLYLALSVCTAAHGMVFRGPPHHPEIDPGLAVSALTLLAGSLAVLRSRRNRDNHGRSTVGKLGTVRNAKVHF
jgi:hypothetical protein